MSIMDAFAVQNMWVSVLACRLLEHEMLCQSSGACNAQRVQVARDLTRVQSSEAAMAERWIGTYPTRDFCKVCTLAGLEPSASHAWFRKLCDTPFEERKTRTHGLDITVSDAARRIAGRTKGTTQEQAA